MTAEIVSLIVCGSALVAFWLNLRFKESSQAKAGEAEAKKLAALESMPSDTLKTLSSLDMRVKRLEMLRLSKGSKG